MAPTKIEVDSSIKGQSSYVPWFRHVLGPLKSLHPAAGGKIDGCHHRVAAGVEGALAATRLLRSRLGLRSGNRGFIGFRGFRVLECRFRA